MNEVNEYIINILRKNSAIVKGYFACPYVDSEYKIKAKEKGRIINPKFIINNHEDIKPNIGMIEKATQSIGKTLEQCKIYMIGDRLSDVEMGLNAKGTGILIASKKTIELGDYEKVKKLQENSLNIYIAKDFLDAATFIKNRES